MFLVDRSIEGLMYSCALENVLMTYSPESCSSHVTVELLDIFHSNPPQRFFTSE